VPGLIKTLADPDWRVRRQAALALGEVGPEAAAATAALKKLGRDPLPLVRRAAADSLARIAPPSPAKK
jgi:HEAT repeat protein